MKTPQTDKNSILIRLTKVVRGGRVLAVRLNKLSEGPNADDHFRLLDRRGWGRTVRIEFELLSVEDMRHVAHELEEIGQRIGNIARLRSVSPLERLIRGRWAIYNLATRRPPRKRARTARKVKNPLP
jgi:hypothetical protein